MWIKTDDLQYVNKIKKGVYEIAEARYAEDKYLLCKGKIIIQNWLDSDDKYDSNCRNIICSFYNSVEEFFEYYPDTDEREEVLAEMLFEETPYYETSWQLTSKKNINEKLEKYLK